MSDSQQRFAAAILLLVVPFILVHLAPHSSLARLAALLIVFTALPLGLLALVFTTKQTVQFRGYSNPNLERRTTAAFKVFGGAAAVLIFSFVTLPTYIRRHNVPQYRLRHGMQIIEYALCSN